MSVIGIKPQIIDEFAGFDSYTDATEVEPNIWTDSLNVVISPNTNAIALRSPANFNNTSALKDNISAVYYDRAAGGVIVFDHEAAGNTSITTEYTTGTTNTSLRTGQANSTRFQSINVNDRLYRVNGTEFIQYASGLGPNVYNVGITAPAAAPTVSIQSGGSLVLTTGVTVSYAYRNSTTGHVGEASAVSSASGATTSSNKTLRIAVTASSQTGVDGIVLFISVDGGSVRYLYVDTAGDPSIQSNRGG